MVGVFKIIISKDIQKMLENSSSWIPQFCQFCQFLETNEKLFSSIFMSKYVPLEKIIVQTPSLPYFKGVGMRNLQSQIRIFQKVHNKVTLTVKLL